MLSHLLTLIDWSTDRLIDWSIRRLIDWLIVRLIGWSLNRLMSWSTDHNFNWQVIKRFIENYRILLQKRPRWSSEEPRPKRRNNIDIVQLKYSILFHYFYLKNKTIQFNYRCYYWSGGTARLIFILRNTSMQWFKSRNRLKFIAWFYK